MSIVHPQHEPPRASRSRSAIASIAALSVALSGALLSTVATTATALEAPAAAPVAAAPVAAAPVVDAAAHSVPGDHNSEMGCAAGDWQPACDQAQMKKNADGVWELELPELVGAEPGTVFKYKIATNKSWDGPNFSIKDGQFTTAGDDVPYTYAGGPIAFYFNPQNGTFFNTATQPMLTVPGSFNDEIGCSDEWLPECLRTMMTDPDGDGIFTFTTADIPAGPYTFKVAHNGGWGEAYPGADVPLVVGNNDVIEFRYNLATHEVSYVSANPPLPGQGQSQAQWIASDVLVVPPALLGGNQASDVTFTLHAADRGGITLVDGAPVLPAGATDLELVQDPAAMTDALKERFPHLKDYLALRVRDGAAAPALATIKAVLTGQLVVTGGIADGSLTSFTGVQIPGVIDDVFDAQERDLGVTWTGGKPNLALWAPTAKDVDVLVWADGNVGRAPLSYQATLQADGSWTLDGRAGWKGGAYRYEVDVYVPATGRVEVNRVTDPYSVGLALNSTHSVFVDLKDPAFRPAPFESAPQPVVRPVDQTIYELHVRDFSVHDSTVPEALQGTYLAFAQEGTAGREHLRTLKEAGLTTVHLLPTFDLATIEEDRTKQLTPPCDLSSFAPDSPEQQACIATIKDQDAYNWGYDPLHFNAPEGSYAVNAYGGQRVAEFRAMVGALHSDGLQVVLDEVFNHTAASGQDPKSILDRVVPGYYQRLNAAGLVETSTCCQNVATEHEMAEKLMVDSVVMWARDYKVDGFRFDLMGHSSRANMEAVRAGLDALTTSKDGVDGSAVYLYGEGWNFGEVANNARFYQATQGQLGGTGIGTYSDRLRDAVRGGGPFDNDPRVRQGFGSGAYTDPNGLDTRTPEELLADAQHQADLVRLGLAGNLRDFSFRTSAGTVQRGDEIDYNGQDAGYADSPEEIINYVDKHDNETLFDVLTLKLPVDTPMADRVRMNTVSLATVTLGQTPAFYQAGSDLLRSKSLDRNSYNSGDWFNRLDVTGQDNGFGRGLPQAPDNESKWTTLKPLLANPALKPTPQDVMAATEAYQDLLRLRFSTELFRLGEAGLIKEKVTFPNSGPGAEPGVIVMGIDDLVGADVDPTLDGLVVVFNASDEVYTEVVDGFANRELELSDIQAEGSDEVVKETTWDAYTGTVSVPARTVAVLTEEQATAPGIISRTPVRIVEGATPVTPNVPQCVQVAGADGIPSTATGVVLNVTAVSPTAPGYVVVYPDTADGSTAAPLASTVNFEVGRDVANAAFVAVPDNGKVCFRTQGGIARIIVDTTGYTLPGSGVEMRTAERVLDTRKATRVGSVAGPVAPRTVTKVQITGTAGVPTTATSVLLNVTVTGATAPGNLRVFPGDAAVPGTSVVNYAPGQDKAAAAVVTLDENGQIAFWSDTEVGTARNPVNVVLDVVGWTAPESTYTGIDPARLVETRAAFGQKGIAGALTAGRVYSVPVAGMEGVPEDATSVVLSVTGIQPSTIGNLRVYPDSNGRGTTPPPLISTLNYIVGRDIPNLVVVDIPADGKVNFYSDQLAGGTVDLAVDVVGYFGGTTSGSSAE